MTLRQKIDLLVDGASVGALLCINLALFIDLMAQLGIRLTAEEWFNAGAEFVTLHYLLYVLAFYGRVRRAKRDGVDI